MMYGTLGAGFFGMFAFIFGFMAGAGSILLLTEGRFISAGVVLVVGALLTVLCVRTELSHPIYQNPNAQADKR